LGFNGFVDTPKEEYNRKEEKKNNHYTLHAIFPTLHALVYQPF